MDDYQPRPIETSDIELPADLAALTELLAENSHDHWAQLRMSEGWSWGPERNDKTKEHPDLVSYNDLSDSEREYDRRTAVETIKAILALGYRISAPEAGHESPPGARAPAGDEGDVDQG